MNSDRKFNWMEFSTVLSHPTFKCFHQDRNSIRLGKYKRSSCDKNLFFPVYSSNSIFEAALQQGVHFQNIVICQNMLVK